jgi:hypothetical protein
VAPGGVNADSTAAAAGLAPADTRPIAPVAMVKANVLSTPLRPVIIFMVVISNLLFLANRHRAPSRPMNHLNRTNRASRLEIYALIVALMAALLLRTEYAEERTS